MRSFTVFVFFTLFVIAMDLYAYRGIHHLLGMIPQGYGLFTWIFWGLSLAMLASLVWAGTQFQKMRDPSLFFGVMVVMGIFLMLYVPKLFFNAIQLIGDLTQLMVSLFNDRPLPIRKWFLIPGAVIGLLLFLGFGLGMLRGRTNVKVFSEEVKIDGLPYEFNGLRIIQLSDLHLAGFYNRPDHIRHVVERVNSLEPDLILFTGDMVHNFSDELDPFTGILEGLRAPLGKFAVLGNHDYGHYYKWESDSEEQANLDRVKEQIR
ncbi:MAG: metallophosphoesterase, partial [Bacteroidales bacterium]|nr:metallophosphoesterase [Bacteroidales bacterium]